MATKNTTKQIVKTGEDQWKNWLKILEARVLDLAMDPDHTFRYGDRNSVSEGVTRRDIVTIYETAYSELAESFHGYQEQMNELSVENRNLKQSVSNQAGIIEASNARLETALRRINGLLELIEQPVGL